MLCLVLYTPQQSLHRAQGPCSWPCQGDAHHNAGMQAIGHASKLGHGQAKPAQNQAAEKPSLPLATTTTTTRQQLPATTISNRVPTSKGATATSSISQAQPPTAPKELKATAVKAPAVHTGSAPTQQPAVIITSTHPMTTLIGPIGGSAPGQPPVGNKRSPAPTARRGAPVIGPLPKQQQPAPATLASTKKVLHALSQEYCHYEAHARFGLFCVSFVQQLHAERPL